MRLVFFAEEIGDGDKGVVRVGHQRDSILSIDGRGKVSFECQEPFRLAGPS